MNNNVYGFEVMDLDGKEIKLEAYKGQVLLIVNVASKCKLANRSYKELSALLSNFHDKGLRVLLFPCKQFLNQEHEDLEKIKEFAGQYSKQFILMGPVKVKGDECHPLFKFLCESLKGTLGNSIKWNFTYFLIGRDGVPVKRYGPLSSISEKDPDLIRCLEQ